jgi:hypothetical protein
VRLGQTAPSDPAAIRLLFTQECSFCCGEIPRSPAHPFLTESVFLLLGFRMEETPLTDIFSLGYLSALIALFFITLRRR